MFKCSRLTCAHLHGLMTEEITYDLGEYKQRIYFIHLRATPNFENVDDFAVIIFYKDANTEEQIQIARVDTTHGYTHFDRLYKRTQPKDPVDWSLWETVEKFNSKWRRWAEGHEKKRN